MGGLRIDRVWESLREWIVVDDKKHEEQINFNTWLNQLEVDLVNMKHIKEPPSPMSLTIDSIYDHFKKDRIWKITYSPVHITFRVAKKLKFMRTKLTCTVLYKFFSLCFSVFKHYIKNYDGYVGIIIQGSSIRTRNASDRRFANGRRLTSSGRRFNNGRRIEVSEKGILYVSPFSNHVKEGS